MMNDHDLSLVLLSSSAFLLATTFTFAALWIRARQRLLRDAIERARLGTSHDDIQHLVQAVDAMAVEVDRISEGQRFTTQILADRILSDTPQQKRIVPVGRAISSH